jgi:hypothetical protein
VNIFTTVFQKAVLEEALVCNEWQIEITVLIISAHGQFWPLHNACWMSLTIITQGGTF